ncbi:formate-dependent phosphoribosylglycinamide formyltransferase [Succinivibrio dextrinosolvens DSM 3072]|uniref:Formate-dependent phosphoribosylglycinamide formyltransferase n=1 Tax=Succinivibrio dextrinosolvens DSM 3072 TaxID=1123324 RepID=A0A1T4V6M1_9GAMM|nr:formate-dependent phosphoribosylglycinamide formyltransferase [Succinivibrio dextrinosolvens]SKA60619.1 formate-dependent phosphoribosylglycinamide formyltransferase [Succinivibrio dextrinosolvens DSM 3072]
MSTSVTIDYQDKTTSALLLGSGELGKEVAIELIRYGIEVIACDRYDNAPAMQVAQKKAIINMKDPDELYELITKLKPDYIIPEIEAISTETLVKLEAEGYNVVPSANAANITMNREAIRTLAAEELSLPTSPYFFASSVSEIKEQIGRIGFPCIMKPIMSSSGKGQSVLKSEGDIEKAFEDACHNGRGGMDRVIVEGFVQFDSEITLLTVSASDGIHFCEPIGHHQVYGDYQESWQPAQLSEEVLIEAKRIASTVVSALGGYGIFGVELFICGNQVIFSELSPRPHDTGMVTMVSQDMSEFALHVRALLGLPIGKITFFGPSASAAVCLKGKGTKITYKNLDDVLKVCPTSQLRIFGKPDIDGERRMAVCLSRGFTTDEAVENVKKMRSQMNYELEDFEGL